MDCTRSDFSECESGRVFFVVCSFVNESLFYVYVSQYGSAVTYYCRNCHYLVCSLMGCYEYEYLDTNSDLKMGFAKGVKLTKVSFVNSSFSNSLIIA